MTPEQRARQEIDRLLGAAGSSVYDHMGADIRAARCAAIEASEVSFQAAKVRAPIQIAARRDKFFALA